MKFEILYLLHETKFFFNKIQNSIPYLHVTPLGKNQIPLAPGQRGWSVDRVFRYADGEEMEARKDEEKISDALHPSSAAAMRLSCVAPWAAARHPVLSKGRKEKKRSNSSPPLRRTRAKNRIPRLGWNAVSALTVSVSRANLQYVSSIHE